MSNLIALDFEKAALHIEQNQNNNKKELVLLLDIIINNGQRKRHDSLQVASLVINTKIEESTILYHLIHGFYSLKNTVTNADAFTHFSEASVLSEKNNHIEYLKLSTLGILELYASQYSPNTNTHRDYLLKYESIATTEIDFILLDFYANRFNLVDVNKPYAYITSSKKLLPHVAFKELSPSLRGNICDDVSVYYRATNQLDSAIYYAKKNLSLPFNNYNKNLLYGANLELAGLYAKKGSVQKANYYLEQVKKYIDRSDSLGDFIKLEQFKALHLYKPQKIYDSAFFSLEKAYEHRALNDINKNKENINELKVALGTAQKEKQLLVKEKENQKQKYLLLALGILLVSGSFIAILINRSTKRKQRIAEQARELEIQKTEKILKEQELTTIDAIIQGQEKERQRLASELHDSTGATLAAAKLQFDHLSKNRDKGEITEELFSKTAKLLDEAYNEVRSMAHFKNSGVIAKNSLLPAIQKLARNASGVNGLTIDVEDFGLEERLDNALEISVFRIIQELVTNIIKHAQATKASIAINQYDDSLNIIVEDNGKGFNARQLPQKDGMGLFSIEKRVEHIEGSMEIDSTPGKGTHILIDIPL